MIKKLGLGFVVALAILALTVNAEAKRVTIHVPDDYATLQAAVDAASPGDKIMIGAGDYAGAIVTKSLEIKGGDGARITDGPVLFTPGGRPLKAGIYLEGLDASGSSISHLVFTGVAFPVFARTVNSVAVTHNIILDAVQGVTLSRSEDWMIAFNEIHALEYWRGGGIGINVGSYSKNCVVKHNKILAASELNGDPEWIFGIVVFYYTEDNMIAQNKVSMAGPAANGIQLAYSFRTKVAFNDLRGTYYDYYEYYPTGTNILSRNFSDGPNITASNRSHDGINPSEVLPHAGQPVETP